MAHFEDARLARQRPISVGMLFTLLLFSLVAMPQLSFSQLPDYLRFNCNQLPPRNVTPTSVAQLHPQDIKVVMALGDSISTGFGILGRRGSVEKDLYEYRGLTWTMGGDSNASSIASFLRHYQPKLVGASHGQHELEFCVPHLCSSRHHPELDALNAAMTGAMIYNFVHGLGDQLSYLLQQLDSMRDLIDINNDWKLLNIFIGSNDMCVRCDDIPIFPTTPDDYEGYFRDTLTELRRRIPRLFVNVIQVFNVSQIYEFSLRSPHCMEVRRLFPVECQCAFKAGAEGESIRQNMDRTAVEYNERLEKVTREFMENRTEDFAVVIQPALKDTQLKNLPLDFINMLDCFHPSLIGHAALSKVLWNNMWRPASQKKTTFDYLAPFFCPKETSTLQIG